VKIAILIPTFQRKEKLQKCLESIQKQTYKDFDVHIYCDNNDEETAKFIADKFVYPVLSESIIKEVVVNNKQEFAPGSWNKAFKQYHDKYDGFLWLVDDAELYPNALEEAVKCMQSNYPDLDGVVGLHQVCHGHPNYTFKYFGQVLIGSKFVERYKEVDYKVCCPAYYFLYQDEELYNHAKALDKFKECPSAILNHNHPAFTKDFDDTHYLSRNNEIRKHDLYTYNLRKEQNLIWGKSWELVNK